MTTRPFRHLCPEADMRDAMTDDEFWAHVADNLTAPHWDDDDAGPYLDPAVGAPPCATCGAEGACGYDSEGRALIHVNEDGDDS